MPSWSIYCVQSYYSSVQIIFSFFCHNPYVKLNYRWRHLNNIIINNIFCKIVKGMLRLLKEIKLYRLWSLILLLNNRWIRKCGWSTDGVILPRALKIIFFGKTNEVHKSFFLRLIKGIKWYRLYKCVLQLIFFFY